MECEPALKAAVARVAWPETRAVLPSDVLPSKNVTVPVGVPAILLTVAVNVTDWPAFDGLADELKVVVVAFPVAVSLKR